jgi:hypothetical protein
MPIVLTTSHGNHRRSRITSAAAARGEPSGPFAADERLDRMQRPFDLQVAEDRRVRLAFVLRAQIDPELRAHILRRADEENLGAFVLVEPDASGDGASGFFTLMT